MSTDPQDLPWLGDQALARRQLQFVLALDCSGSMRGEKIASLNYAIRSALAELASVARENPEVDLRLSAVKFSDKAEWHVAEPTRIDDVEWADLTAGGETAMGDALERIVDLLSGDKVSGRQLPPVVVLVTDGYPTDDFEAALDRFLGAEITRHATRIGIAIGETADLTTLEAFIGSGTNHIRPLRARNAHDLVRHVKWATTAPVKARSSARNTGSVDGDLALQTKFIKEDDSSVVW